MAGAIHASVFGFNAETAVHTAVGRLIKDARSQHCNCLEIGEVDRPWTRYVIRDMVTNPKYIGTNLSNRLSGKLRQRRLRNPRQMWIRRDNAFEGIINAEVFRQAELVAAGR